MPLHEPKQLQQAVKKLLAELQETASCDFAALALYDPENRDIRWRLAFGALNDRYRGIAIRIGKGIAGDVMLTGRTLAIERFPEQFEMNPLDYPIMMLEQLRSCYAIAVKGKRNVFGVLMLAMRKEHSFAPEIKQAAVKLAAEMGQLYSPSYETLDIPGQQEQQSAMPSPLEVFFQEQKSKTYMSIDLLDQRVTQISERYQREMISWFERLISLFRFTGNEQIYMSVERSNGQWMSVELFVDHKLLEPRESLSWLIERIGELKGNVELYNEPGGFRLIVNLSMGLLFEDKPWSF